MSITEVMQLPSLNREEGKRFDYKGLHRYIITLQARRKVTELASEAIVFSVLDVLRDTALEHTFDVYAYCFFPRKLVLIIRGKEETSDMKAFLTKFRVASSSAVNSADGYRLWDRRYTERVLRRTEDSKSIALEVFKQTESEKIVAKARDYPYLGSFVIPRKKFFSEFRKSDVPHRDGKWKPKEGGKGRKPEWNGKAAGRTRGAREMGGRGDGGRQSKGDRGLRKK